jgi:hypothetical protein
MLTADVLELVAILGSIVGVWFTLIGWKLVPSDPNDGQHPRPISPIRPEGDRDPTERE